jgi:hypothetical protein
MALANYSDLQASVALWLNRSDLTAVIPDFVSLAESRMARQLRLRKQVTNTTLATVAGTQSVTLPADFLEAENLTITSVTPQATMSVVTPEIMDRRYPAGYNTGQPIIYCYMGDKLQLGPTPDAVYTISLDYYARFGALASNSTNWLLTNYPNLYLFATLAEAAMYMADEDKAAIWLQRYERDAEALKDADDAATRSGSTMRVRTL